MLFKPTIFSSGRCATPKLPARFIYVRFGTKIMTCRDHAANCTTGIVDLTGMRLKYALKEAAKIQSGELEPIFNSIKSK